jgi:hypothetical protein
MWDEFYDDLKLNPYVRPCSLNVEWWNMYIDSDFRFVDEALRKMDLFDLVCLKEDYNPDVIRQFF